MKLLILLACVVGAFAFTIDDVDFENLVPIYETDEWKALHPDQVTNVHEARAYQSRNGRIWGGREAAAGELPYQVGIVVLLSRQAFCGGSIVSNNFVLSAAACFPGDPNAVVELGSIDRNTATEFINAAEKVLHPQFNAANSDNDLALIRLVRSITFTPNIAAVRLPNRRQVSQSFENQQGRISGWGTTGGGESSPIRVLRVAFSPVISQVACRVRFPNSASDRTLCIEGTSVNICSGDFGGPVTIQDADQRTTQIGVSSFINPLGCTRGFPGGFTRVSQYLEWIGANSDVVIRDGF